MLPAGLTPHFVRGYFDGDGCITHEGHLTFTSNSKTMLSDLERLFTVNVPGYVKLHHLYRYRKCWKLIKSKFQALGIYEFMYRNATVYLNRKYARYCQIFGLAC